jgi:hypothetical protein
LYAARCGWQSGDAVRTTIWHLIALLPDMVFEKAFFDLEALVALQKFLEGQGVTCLVFAA